MDISAHAISLADRPQRAVWVTSARIRRRPILHLFLSSRTSRRVKGFGVITSSLVLSMPLSDQADWAAAFGASTRRNAVSFAAGRGRLEYRGAADAWHSEHTSAAPWVRR